MPRPDHPEVFIRASAGLRTPASRKPSVRTRTSVIGVLVAALVASALMTSAAILARTATRPATGHGVHDAAGMVEVAGPAGTSTGRLLVTTVPSSAVLDEDLARASEDMQHARQNAVDAASRCVGRHLDVAIDAGRVTGGSAGLMLALTIVDEVTETDLTGGRVVAGTGGIDTDGRVLEVLAVAEKAAVAEREGAAVFLLPRAHLEEAPAVTERLTLVGVDTLDEAVRALTDGQIGCAATP